jgi:short subunit fatty acids transporter
LLRSAGSVGLVFGVGVETKGGKWLVRAEIPMAGKRKPGRADGVAVVATEMAEGLTDLAHKRRFLAAAAVELDDPRYAPEARLFCK